MSKVRVIARGKAKKGQESAVRELLQSLVEPTRREEGCIKYELLQGTTDPADFVMAEEWASEAALDAHLEKPDVVAVLQKLGHFLATAPEIARYRLLTR
ncbi:MAG: putative quinol monooxygenase [Planctomycetota bacterium]